MRSFPRDQIHSVSVVGTDTDPIAVQDRRVRRALNRVHLPFRSQALQEILEGRCPLCLAFILSHGCVVARSSFGIDCGCCVVALPG